MKTNGGDVGDVGCVVADVEDDDGLEEGGKRMMREFGHIATIFKYLVDSGQFTRITSLRAIK